MQSIRARMTVWYATALILSIAVFAIVLYFGRRSATYQDLDRQAQSRDRASSSSERASQQRSSQPAAQPARTSGGGGGRSGR